LKSAAALLRVADPEETGLLIYAHDQLHAIGLELGITLERVRQIYGTRQAKRIKASASEHQKPKL
jgi:hypothetical protein